MAAYECSPERAPPQRLKDSTSAICFGASPLAAVDYLYGARNSNGPPSAPDVAAKCGSRQGEDAAAAKPAALGWKVVPNAGAKLGQ
jgi:hypothetical protein